MFQVLVFPPIFQPTQVSLYDPACPWAPTVTDYSLTSRTTTQRHKGDQVSENCMTDLANLHIVQGEEAISASSTDKDLTNTLNSGVGVQGDKLRWMT